MHIVTSEETLRPADEQDASLGNDGTLAAQVATKASHALAVPLPPPPADADARPVGNLAGNTALSDEAQRQVLDQLPKPLRLDIPAHADDRDDPYVLENQLTPEQRERLGLPTMRRAPKEVPMRLRPDHPTETALRIAEKVAGTADAGSLFDVAEVMQAGNNTHAAVLVEPKLRLRVHALVCRNSDGRLSNGSFGQSREELGVAIGIAITAANTILATANIELIFYPTSDLEIRQSTSLNQDFILPASALAQLQQYPPLSQEQVDALAAQYTTTPTRNSVASQYPGKLVLLFAEGTTLARGRDQWGQAGDIPVPADYDGDHKADVAVWRPIEAVHGTTREGNWHLLASRFSSYRYVQWGVKTDKPVPADYDGDGRADIAVWRPGDGMWHIMQSSDGAVRSEQWGQNGDIPVPGRYDSDSAADFAVWRPSTGTWHIKNSRTGATRSVQWGQNGDIPVPADYDGDGITDIAVWRPSDGKWYIIQSSNGAMRVQQWGVNGDRPVPGDYYGDGKADYAVFRPSEGNWYVLNSANNASQVIRYGEGSDILVLADYNGDRRMDIGVWRPSNGQWYITASSTQNNRWDDWSVVAPSGGGFSWEDLKFVKLGGGANPDPNDYGQAAFIAHEVGHYLHLHHTHGRNYVALASGEGDGLNDQQRADVLQNKIIAELNQGLNEGADANNLVNVVFDADDATVNDTAADPGPDYFTYINRALHGGDNSGGACGVAGSVTVTVQNGQSKTVAPDRTLVMSYFKGCSGFVNRYSPQQARRMRNALINGNRRELVRVQLGETSYPGEVVAAVWDPNPNGQYMSYGHTFDTFRALFDQRMAQGFRLHAQQAYTKNGVTLYDHIWNPGDYPQDVIWGWTVADFATRHNQNVANGYYLHHLESYLLPDNQIRVNAMWNKTWGGVPTAWVQGWAEVHLASKLTQMHHAGWRVRHVNAWNLPNNGDVRFDVVWEQLTWRDEVVRLNMTGAQVVQEYGTQWQRAFKFRTLDTFRIGNEQRYAGVWNPNTNGQLVLWGHTREQINQQYDESWQQGWKISSMAMVKF